MAKSERWTALQSCLTAARAAAAAGDSAEAIAQLDRALAIDPDFLAAQALRDRLRESATATTSPGSRDAASAPATDAAPDSAFGRPVVSADGYARFQERARRRRLDNRLAAARNAIAEHRWEDAAAALHEARELDASRPEIDELDAALSAATRPRSPIGPRLFAVAACALIVLAGSSLHDGSALMSHPMAMFSAFALPPPPLSPIVTIETRATDGLSDEQTSLRSRVAADVGVFRPGVPVIGVPVDQVPTRTTGIVMAEPPISPAFASPVGVSVPVAPPAASIVAGDAQPATVRAELAASPVNASSINLQPVDVPPVDDEQLVRDVLRQYRVAYDDLDARSARAIWPAVDQAALARAFDGLEAQTLTFRECAIDVQGVAATAICRGSTSYVPKVGSRDPHLEPRTWTFTLRKRDAGWRIETARAEQ